MPSQPRYSKSKFAHLVNKVLREIRQTGAPTNLNMDRRSFLALSSGTVAAAMTTACGDNSDSFNQTPGMGGPGEDLGVSEPAEDPAGAMATRLDLGSEVFTDTVYAQPVISGQAVNSHAVIEGVQSRRRLQSDLDSQSPEEYDFLDSDYHYGRPELIQVEQDSNSGEWALVHYFHPLTARTDGGRTDSLGRHVIADNAFKNPTQVVAITGTNANKFESLGVGNHTTCSYLIFVLDEPDPSDPTKNVGQFYVGQGSVTTGVSASLPDYPIDWSRSAGDEAGFGREGIVAGEKYTSSAWQSAGDNAAPSYQAEQQVEHLVLYYAEAVQDQVDPAGEGPGYINVISMIDSGGGLPLEFVATEITNCSLCSNPSGPEWPLGARVLHLDWDPTDTGEKDWRQLTNVVLASSSKASNGDVTYTMYAANRSQADNTIFPVPVDFASVKAFESCFLGAPWQQIDHTVSSADLQGGELEIDFSKIHFVHDLFMSWIDGNLTHMKLLAVEGRGVFLLSLTKVKGAKVANNDFLLTGHFPLAFPDAAGLGNITGISGGISKFNGWRYIATDDDGNLFQLRQRRSEDADTPYAPPIYGIYTDTGEIRTSWGGSRQDLPSGTSASSNLNSLAEWFTASTKVNSASYYNYLLSTALAFSTDDTSQSQGIWLGSNTAAAYAPRRFSLDSEHIAIKPTTGSTGDDYGAYMVFKNPVDKTWRERQIATQRLPLGPGLEETGQHYQAILTPVNDSGQPLSLQSIANKDLMIEVRADSPCVVIDDTNNLYYDVDRYTSFLAAPDRSSGKLNLLVKAETFSQVLYARLVNTSTLDSVLNDNAMLGTTDPVVFPWQTINISSQAQQRMANDGSSAALAAATGITDTEVYVSGDSLSASNDQNPWDIKGSYNPTTSNLGSIATYLNTSGQNMNTDSADLGLAGAQDGMSIDPLFAVTAVPTDPSRPTVTTAFGYAAGSVNTTTGPSAELLVEPLGSIWSSISHALHDALHWLQNVEEEVYNELASTGVSVVSAVDSITVTVSKDIMKQVNGVEQELKEVVSTVEEYASVVANLIVTIVKQTFIYKFIDILITLISLFFHLKDIQKLSDSLCDRFNDIVNGTNGQSLPDIGSYSMTTEFNKYLGINTQADQAFNADQSSIDQMVEEIVGDLLKEVLNNPLTSKLLNKLLSELTKAVDESLPKPPISFSADSSITEDVVRDLDSLEQNLVDGVANLTTSVVSDLINQIASDIENPKATFQNLQNGLSGLLEQIALDVLDPVFEFVDDLQQQAPSITQSLLDEESFIEIDLAVIADLCNLLGIGSGGNGKFKLSAKDAVFFPLAAIAWVTIYAAEGKSVSSVSDLEGSLSAPAGSRLEGLDVTRWNFCRLCTDGVLQLVIGVIAIAKQGADDNEDNLDEAEKVLFTVPTYLASMRWVNDFSYGVYTISSPPYTTVELFNFVNTSLRLATAVTDTVVRGAGINSGKGWSEDDPKRTDKLQLINVLATVTAMCVDTFDTIESSPNVNAIINITGQDLQRTQGLGAFLFNYLKEELSGFDELFIFWMLAAPAGFGLQADALQGD